MLFVSCRDQYKNRTVTNMSKLKRKVVLKPDVEEKTEFIISGSVSDMKKREKGRDIETDLFGSKSIKEVIDSFEEQTGIKNKVFIKPKEEFKNILLSPGYDEEDRTLLNQLLNDNEMYRIVKMTESWTARGEFKLFIIYAENLDLKAKREQENKVNE